MRKLLKPLFASRRHAILTSLILFNFLLIAAMLNALLTTYSPLIPPVSRPYGPMDRLPLFGMEGLSHIDMNETVMILNIFSSRCDDCRAEQPVLQDLAYRHKLPVYGVVMEDTHDNIAVFLTEFASPYTRVGFDNSGIFTNALGVEQPPVTFIVIKDLKIRWRHDGPLTAALLEEEILPVIEALEQEK